MPRSARELSIADFTYDLPDERIARHPVARREEAKQLVYQDGKISEGIFRDLPERLPAGTLLIGNRTRVIHARLHFPIGEGKRPVEIFCLDPLQPVEYAMSLGAQTQVQWKCLIGGNRRWKSGVAELEVEINGQQITLTAERGKQRGNSFDVYFSWTPEGEGLTFGEVLAAAGSIPLPPYLGRQTEAADQDRYQTVFAKTEGSVAAPTAGLHFTPEILTALQKRGVDWEEVTLHVGAGTFKPVSSPTLGEHEMHREYFEINLPLVDRICKQLAAGKPIVCVGTTSLRCVESLFHIASGSDQPDGFNTHIGQWAAEEADFPEKTSLERLERLRDLMSLSGNHQLNGYTSILLSPASDIRIADGLITNFHQPNSTLLLLVAAFVGDDWKRIYGYALENNFRFLSYGDSSLLWKR